MKAFTTIQKLDQAIFYGMELASSLSVVLLSVGVVASMSNTLTNGWLLGSNIAISRTWIISQTVAMDTGLIVSIVRSLLLAKSKQWLQCSLYALLSILLLSTTAIVSNIESIQQTLGITLTEEQPKPKALPAPKKRTATGDNLERVRVYMAEHQGASIRQVAKDLELGISTANKWMRQVAAK